MAKGIEDTAFYRWHRLVALNEVGGDPELLDDAAPEVMHAWAEHQQRHWPLGMTTLSTHDTKRSEDVRARLLAVAGDGESWQACSEAFAEEAAARNVDGPTAQLVWQTLLGAGDLDDERLATYLTKAMREAKLRTSWLDPDPEYESSVLALATEAIRPGSLHALVQTALDHNREAVRALVLGQKLLQLTLPGMPDTYQGCELVDLSLVDPDNRRPGRLSATGRARLQRVLQDEPPRDLDDEKLLVTHRALALRKELPDSFGDHGEYHPVAGTSRHLVGFLRGAEVATLVTRGPARLRATERLARRDGQAARRALARRAVRCDARGGREPLPRPVRRLPGGAAAQGAPCRDAVAVGAGGRGRRPGGRRPSAPPMSPSAGGWWRTEVVLGDGDRYGFSLDGGDPRPDPRGLALPDGPHGLSAVFDTSRFAWSDDGLARCRPRGRGDLRDPRRHVHPRGHPRQCRRAACRTWSTSASPSSSCCPSRRTRAATAGATTASRRTPSTRRTADPPPCSASSTPHTRTGSRSASTWCTTTSARTATTSPRWGRTSPTATPRPGARR